MIETVSAAPDIRSKAWIALAVLAIASLAFGDDLLEGRRVSLVDMGVALVIAGVVLVGMVVLRVRTAAGRAQEVRAQRGEEMLEAIRSIGEAGHAPEVVNRLISHACSALGVERCTVVAREHGSPDAMTVIAGHGIPHDMIGTRWPIHQGMSGHVFATEEALVVDDYQRLTWPVDHPPTVTARAGIAVPLRWHGDVRAVLAVITTSAPRRFEAAEVKLLEELAELGAITLEHAEMRERLERAADVATQALAAAVSARDQYTAEHSDAVVEVALEVGGRLGLDPTALARLEAAARLHDVGKLAIPDAILRKPGPLDEAEWEVMREHPTWGADLLGRVGGLEDIAEIVRAEHERWDGRGYPAGLSGNQIPLEARIVFACDAFHAMTSDRPYRKALPMEMAVHELIGGAGSQFDPAVVDALVAYVRGFGRGRSPGDRWPGQPPRAVDNELHPDRPAVQVDLHFGGP